MVSIQPLTLSDISAAMQLVEVALWNQTPADWERVIEYQPHGCFKATMNDRLVGTVTSTSYGVDLAWIGMMLVDPTVRRQGIGRALMRQVIDVLESANTKTIKLDATPAGRPLYEQLGFVAQFDFQRWRRNETAADALARTESSQIEPQGDPLGEQMELDRRAFGVDRSCWLTKMSTCSRREAEDAGYGMLRRGRIADYLGPVVADSPLQARNLISKLVRGTSAVIFWDLPQQQEATDSLARSLGFEPVRTLTRMSLGPDTSNPRLELQYAICDPATG